MSYLTEAFRLLNLTEAAFKTDNKEDILGAKDLLNNTSDNTLDVFDSDALSEDELQDSYVGNVILQCSVCHKPIFKSPDEIDMGGKSTDELEEDTLVNVGEECPICHETDGFYIKAEVKPFHAFDIEYDVEDDEEDEEDDEEDIDDIEDDEDIDLDFEPEDIDDDEDVDEDEDDEDIEEDEEDRKKSKSKNESFSRHRSIRKLTEANARLLSGIRKRKLTESREGRDALISSIEQKLADSDDLFNQIRDTVGGVVFDESLQEGFNNVDVSTDSEHLTMTQDENQKVTITTEPIGGGEFSDDISEGDEFLSPVSDDTLGEIDDANAEEDEEGDELNLDDLGFGEEEGEEGEGEEDLDLDLGEEGDEGEEDLDLDLDLEEEPKKGKEKEADIDITDIKEESFNRLGTSYLKNTYDNVVSFNTTAAKLINEKLILEGVIMFDSGNRKATKFIFESKDITKNGKLRFLGENADITRGKKAFSMIASINNGCLLTESLKYDYTQGKTRITGKETL